MRREAKFQTLFRHWVKAHPTYSTAYELKQTTTQSLPFSAVKEHQITALRAVKDRGFLYKIPDDSMGIKPFDMVYLRYANAYIVIRYPSCFCLIEVDTFRLESIMSKRKSLTEKRAREIATLTVELINKGVKSD